MYVPFGSDSLFPIPPFLLFPPQYTPLSTPVSRRLGYTNKSTGKKNEYMV